MCQTIPGADDIEDFIRANLPLAPVTALPNIRLHRAGPASGLRRLAAADTANFTSPYWAYSWPGGLALAQYILERPDVVSGRRILDLGTGSGLVAIACAKAGAREVRAVDIDPYAAAAARLNAAANDVILSVTAEDVMRRDPPSVGLVTVGDLFYAPRLAAKVATFLDRCLAAKIEVLVGDIGRADLPMHRLRRLTAYRVPEVGEAVTAASKTGGIYRFESPQV